MTSKVHPAADYWTVYRENLGKRLCYFWWAEKQRAKWRNSFKNWETFYPSRPKAEVDNITLLDLQNSSYPTQPHSIIALLFIQNIFKLLKEKMSSMFFCSPKITQPRPQIFSVNGLLICSGLHFWRHWFNITKFFPNLVNRNWLWWIMRVALTKQKRGYIFNE